MEKAAAEALAEAMRHTGIEAALNRDFVDENGYYISAYDPRYKNAFSIHSVTEWEAYVLAVAQAALVDKASAFTYLLGELHLRYSLVDLILIANDPKLDEPKNGRRIQDWRTYCHTFQEEFMRFPLEKRLAVIAAGLYKADQEEWD